jgi:hypothetical protein
MSKFLSQAAKQEFDDEVLHAFQTGGTDLRNAVTLRTGVVGDIYKFRHMGKGMARQKPTQALVIPMDINHELINCPLENWHASEYTDIFDQAEVNFDEQRELASTIAMGLGRRNDQLIIDALGASSFVVGTQGAVATTIGGAGTDLNVAKLRRAKRLLDNNGVPNTDRHILHSAEGLEAMLGQTEATSADFNTVRALVNGDLNSFVGFQFHAVEAREEGGLPKASAVRETYAFQKTAVGLAIGIEVTSEVNYAFERTSWLCTGIMKAGAVVRDADGTVKLSTTEAA